MKELFDNCANNTGWKNFYIKYRESYHPPVDDFHEHDYYEINFIISGNVKILLSDCVVEGTGNHIVLTAPGTPHFVSCRPDLLYSRIYLLFAKEFIDNCIPEWNTLSETFGSNGKIVNISPSQQEFCRMLISKLQNETSLFRQKLLILYLISYIGEFSDNTELITCPPYIMKALVFMEEHYNEKITAASLAEMLHIGRTTLMINFKKYTGSTMNDHIVRCRLKNVCSLLKEGKKESEIAERCGFGDVSGLIRSFKRSFGMTPSEYIKKRK